jgi:hypothetical protein
MKKYAANLGKPYPKEKEVKEVVLEEKSSETLDTIEEALEQHIDPKEENWKVRREKKKLASRSSELENRD